MTLLDKLNFLLNSRNLDVRKLSKQSDLGYTAIRNWYDRGYENMALSSFKKLCSFFNVTMDSMAYDDREIEYRTDRTADSLNKEEKEMIDMYSCIDDDAKRIVRDTLLSAYNIAAEKKDGKTSSLSEVG